jgi:hypothetical protein
MAYKAQGNKPVIPRIFYYRHSWLAWFYRGFPIKGLMDSWITSIVINGMLSEKTRLKKVKSIELMYFLFSSRMWYTANSTDSESVDLIMKSIIFSFEVHRLFFFQIFQFLDDKLVSVVKKEANCEAELLKN